MDESYELPVIKKAASVPANKLNEYVGTYRIDSATTREVRLERGQLVTQRAGGPVYPILPEGDDRFFIGHDQMTTFTFLRDNDGVVIGHVLNQAFNSDTAMLVR
jgi:hypothetical protein